MAVNMSVMLVVAIAGLAMTQVTADTLQESHVIQLASELNVGYELVSKCTSYQYEASQLCAGRKPFRLYGDTSNGCRKYFWCTPEHGACVSSCEQGMVFDQACNCCKPPSDSSGFDSGICSSIVSRSTQPQQQPPAPELASAQTNRRLGRRLYAAEPLSSESLTYASDEERMKARAKARARLLQRRRRREAAARATAAATVAGSSGDSLTSDPSSSAIRHLDNGVGVWNSYGKKYRGPWMSRNIVKEPAFRAPVTASSSASQAANATATPAAAVLPTSGSGDAVANRHHHRLLQQQATAGPAVASSAETESTIPAIPSITVSRHLQRKRIDPSRTESGGVGAAAVAEQAVDTPYVSISSTEAAGLHNHPTVRHGMRPMDKRPAAKAVDPQDEQGAAFAGAIAGTDGSAARRNSRPVHIRRQRPAQPFAV